MHGILPPCTCMYICMTIISLVPILAEGKGSLANLVILFKGICHRYWHALKCEICEYHFFYNG